MNRSRRSVLLLFFLITCCGGPALADPLASAIAFWQYQDTSDSNGGESSFTIAGDFSVGNSNNTGSIVANNSDGLAANEGPSSGWGEAAVPVGHELHNATMGSLSMWARFRFTGFDDVDDVFTIADGGCSTPGHSYALEIQDAFPRFITLGSGEIDQSVVAHSQLLAPNRWYDATGVFDAAALTMTIYLYDAQSGAQLGEPASLGVSHTSLRTFPETVLLFFGAPCEPNGVNLGGQLEGAAVWNRALSAAEVAALSESESTIFIDGFESGDTSAWP